MDLTFKNDKKRRNFIQESVVHQGKRPVLEKQKPMTRQTSFMGSYGWYLLPIVVVLLMGDGKKE